MEAKLMMLEKRELAWREEKREALADLDLAKERIREEVLWDIFFAFLVHIFLIFFAFLRVLKEMSNIF